MAETLGDVDRLAVDIVEANRVPLPKRRRTDADVDDVVDDCTACAGDVLRLARRHIGEVDTSDCAPLRDRGVGLLEVERMPNSFSELVEAVVLEEHASVVGELLRRDLEATGNAEFANLHTGSLERAYHGERSDSADHSNHRCRNDAMPATPHTRPRILVLLTTHNGAEFIDEQLGSVLAQDGVDVTVVVSDDNSTDKTREILAQRASTDSRLRVLDPGVFGSAAANFFRLIRDVDAAGFDAISLCDQDDVWESWKLRRHYELLTRPQGVDGRGPLQAVSSNVTAFDAEGNEVLIAKNQPQQLADYAFESGGPGSTFLLKPTAYDLVRSRLLVPDGAASQVRSHDWMIYALVRASGGRWFVDGDSSVRYRQHSENLLGANEGWRQNWRRLRQIADKSHRHDARLIIAAAREVASGATAERLDWLANAVSRTDPATRIRLARRGRQLRRRRRDQLALAVTIVAGIW